METEPCPACGCPGEKYDGHVCDDYHIDPVCLFHGLKRSEHECLVCCLCFKDLTPEECWQDDDGQKWDVCWDCKKMEEKYAE